MRLNVVVTFFFAMGVVLADGQTAGDLQIQDTRSMNLMPNEFTWGTPFSLRARVDFKIRSLIGLPGLGYYSTLLSLPQWPDNSGDKIHQLGFGNSGIFFRQAWPMATAWEPWRKVLLEDESGAVGVGIGTRSPGAKFQVNSTMLVAPFVPGESGNYLTDEGARITISDGNIYDNVHGGISFGGMYVENGVRYNATYNHIEFGSGYLRIRNNQQTKMFIGSGDEWGNQNIILNPGTGNVGIGTLTPSERLSVNGNIRTKKLIVTQTGWPDYVFANDYYLMPLNDVKKFINKNKHLPGIPSAEQVTEAGLDIGDTQALLLKKIEELTLYVIQLKEENQAIKNEIQRIKNKR